MGAQLDRLRYGVSITPDPFTARDEVENHLLQQAGIIRCIDAFARRKEFDGESRHPKAITEYKALVKIQKHTFGFKPQGEIALGILRAYHERCTQSKERGLLEVYNYLRSIAPVAIPPPPKEIEDILQAFREGTAKRARSISCEAYADSLLGLQRHVRLWNNKNK